MKRRPCAAFRLAKVAALLAFDRCQCGATLAAHAVRPLPTDLRGRLREALR